MIIRSISVHFLSRRRRKRSWRNKKIKGITDEPFIERVPQGSWCFVQSGTVFQKEKEPKELQDQPKIIEKVQE